MVSYVLKVTHVMNYTITCIVGKPIATRKLAHQLMRTATDIAAGRGPWIKIFGKNISLNLNVDLGEQFCRDHPRNGSWSHSKEHNIEESGDD